MSEQTPTPRTDAVFETMNGERFTPDKCHPFYVLASELEEINTTLERALRTSEAEVERLESAIVALRGEVGDLRQILTTYSDAEGDLIKERAQLRADLQAANERAEKAERETERCQGIVRGYNGGIMADRRALLTLAADLKATGAAEAISDLLNHGTPVPHPVTGEPEPFQANPEHAEAALAKLTALQAKLEGKL